MKTTNQYQARLIAPFGVLGIVCNEDTLTGIQFLAADAVAQAPLSRFAEEVCKQLLTYFDDADFHFSLPFKLAGTEHQNRVWKAMCAIAPGQTRQYGELANELASSPRAVGRHAVQIPFRLSSRVIVW